MWTTEKTDLPIPADFKLFSPEHTRPGFYTVTGPAAIQHRILKALPPLLALNRLVHWVDAGNRFDPYSLARWAQAQGYSPRTILQRVRLSRPFTALQLNTLMAQRLPNLPPLSTVVLSDPLALFYDPQLPDRQVESSFRRFLALARHPPVSVLGLIFDRRPPPGREHLAGQLSPGQEGPWDAHSLPQFS